MEKEYGKVGLGIRAARTGGGFPRDPSKMARGMLSALSGRAVMYSAGVDVVVVVGELSDDEAGRISSVPGDNVTLPRTNMDEGSDGAASLDSWSLADAHVGRAIKLVESNFQ